MKPEDSPPEPAGDPPAPTETLDLAGPPPVGAGELPPGTEIGRYLLLHRLGAGGMGVVYAAYDPELDRRIALKLLHPGRTGAADPLRLLREAQAAARLSHPQVVTVHDAGATPGGDVYVAMEHVVGRTLDAWLVHERPGWRRALDRLLLAGRGLAAAHAAGLVHRDFKPGNVLVADDGAVKVADFGLARPAVRQVGEDHGEDDSKNNGEDDGDDHGEDARTGGAAAPPRPEPRRRLLETPLTRAGGVSGTPGYMAPEQLRGEPAGPAADQFSFCATVYEALYGERPFAGDQPAAEQLAALAGRVREAPAGSRVPAWVRRVLLRGLAPDPADRHPSMEALLAALAHDPAVRRRRRLAWAAGLAVAALAVTGLVRWQQQRGALCAGAGEHLAGLWDDDARGAGSRAFAATGLPFAAASWQRAATTLDGYAAGWTAMHRDACEATHLRGEQSPELLDRRMACLDRRLAALGALARVFADADRAVVRRAVDAAGALPPLAACADPQALLARAPLPADPAARRRIRQVEDELAAAVALADAGKEPAALARLRPLEAAARATGHPPLVAEVLYRTAYLLDHTGSWQEAEDAAFAALAEATAGGDDEIAARASASLAWIEGHRFGDAADGERWGRLAEAHAVGARGGGELHGRLLVNLAAVYLRAGRLDEAATLYRRAADAAGEAPGAGDPVAATALANLAVVRHTQGRQSEARQLAAEALGRRRRILDPGHPEIARSLNGLGNIESALGDDAAAGAAYREALEILDAAYGPLHPDVLGVRINLATVLKDGGRLEQARAAYLGVREAAEQLDPEGSLMSLVLTNLGEIELLLGRPDAALAAYQRARELDEAALGPDHPDVAWGLHGVAAALLELGRPDEAERAAARALALRQTGGAEPRLAAESRFLLARVRWELGAGAAALALARQARDELAGGESETVATVEQIDGWLAERTGRAAAGGGR